MYKHNHACTYYNTKAKKKHYKAKLKAQAKLT